MKQVIVALLALPLIACSSASNNSAGDGGPGGSGGAGATGGTGGSGATAGSGASGASGGTGGSGGSSSSTCGPGDQDCHCAGGTFQCVNNRLTCVCPQQCTRATDCGQDAICFFYDGNCGGGASGYCLSLATAAQSVCVQKPVCGCDGSLYDDSCAAIAARTSTSAAPTSNCAAKPQPCGAGPSPVSCYPTQYCSVDTSSGSTSAYCSAFNPGCAQPSCSCLSYNANVCACAVSPSGLVTLTCAF